MHPATRILTADLRWVAVADLEVGRELVACDEYTPPGRGVRIGGRRMRTVAVEAVCRAAGPAWRIGFADGRSVVCAADRCWLRKRHRRGTWSSIDGTGASGNGRAALRPGDIVRTVAVPWTGPEGDDLWFGGVIDGEGSFDFGRSAGARLGVTQCDGPVLQRMLGHCHVRRYGHHVTTVTDCKGRLGTRPVHTVYISSIPALFRVLGLSRPVRFLGARWWEGKRMPDLGWREIAAIEPLGACDLADIRTSTGTCIAEGFVAHDAAVVAPPVAAPPRGIVRNPDSGARAGPIA